MLPKNFAVSEIRLCLLISSSGNDLQEEVETSAVCVVLLRLLSFRRHIFDRDCRL
jgi:hypothetical protein